LFYRIKYLVVSLNAQDEHLELFHELINVTNKDGGE